MGGGGFISIIGSSRWDTRTLNTTLIDTDRYIKLRNKFRERCQFLDLIEDAGNILDFLSVFYISLYQVYIYRSF